MLEVEFVELAGEAHEAVVTFRRKMLEAVEASKLSDRVLLAIIAQELGDMVGFHKLNGCCDPEELIGTMMLNFKQGFVNRIAKGLDEITPTTSTKVH